MTDPEKALGDTDRRQVAAVLAEYPQIPAAGSIETLGNAGGFSGAAIWRISETDRAWCLRRWPVKHPSEERLRFIHGTLLRAAAAGLKFVPAPIRARNGETFVFHAGHFWELTPWMPGEANFSSDPNPAKLNAAFKALRAFHDAVAVRESQRAPLREAEGFRERYAALEQLDHAEFQRLNAAVRGGLLNVKPEIESKIRALADVWLRCAPTAAPVALRALQQVSGEAVVLQPCIRDIWHDHVLFCGDEVTGIIDFGAMRRDAVWFDVARLQRSLVGNDSEQWLAGLNAYGVLPPPESPALVIVRALDQSAAVLTGYNWIQWLYVERRAFADMERVAARFEAAVRHLTTVFGQSG